MQGILEILSFYLSAACYRLIIRVTLSLQIEVWRNVSLLMNANTRLNILIPNFICV